MIFVWLIKSFVFRNHEPSSGCQRQTLGGEPDFAPSSDTLDVALSSETREAMSGRPGGYVGQAAYSRRLPRIAQRNALTPRLPVSV